MEQLLWYHYLIGAILIVSSLVIIVTVMLQQSKQQGLSGAIAGGADTFFDKNKGRTIEAKLAKITKIIAGVFFVVSLVAVILFALVK
ncbi:MAG: preprotein translocase subunit SecG [Acutalibacteraceae bacterium]